MDSRNIMSKTLRVFVMVLCFGVIANAMYILEDEEARPSDHVVYRRNIGDIPYNARKMHASIVPINNPFIFKMQTPCEEGLQRDALGICREVW